MRAHKTLCGYDLAETRKTLVDAINRRDKRAAQRWTAELVVTPAAVGSLWAAFWVAWATGCGSGEPTVPLLLNQSWTCIVTSAKTHVSAAADSESGSGWVGFRNDTDVRSRVAEVLLRLLDQGRQTPVVWPTKDIALHDVGVIRCKSPTETADGPVVMRAWIREDDALELRHLAGHWLDAIKSGDLRTALSIIAWTLLPFASQGIPLPLRCGSRGPISLPIKMRTSPLWFWLSIGRESFASRTTLHPGWLTLHGAVADAFAIHWTRWTVSDRMRVLLAWTLQLRASFSPTLTDWSLRPLHITLETVEAPYREISVELANPQMAVLKTKNSSATALATEKEHRRADQQRIEERIAQADDAVMSMMGLSE